MDIELVRPDSGWKNEAMDYRQEHFDNKEFVINGSELLDKTDSYEQWLTDIGNNASPETVNPEWVLTDTFFAVRKDDKKIVGIIDLRHELKGFLMDFGNIGYSVRPSERRKGYGSRMFFLILEEARKCGLKELYVSVDRDNLPSAKIIRKNGGKYNRSFVHDGQSADIYGIILKYVGLSNMCYTENR